MEQFLNPPPKSHEIVHKPSTIRFTILLDTELDISIYSELMPGSDSDPEQDEENGDFFVSKGKSKKLPDLMRTCKTKKCGCGKGNFFASKC